MGWGGAPQSGGGGVAQASSGVKSVPRAHALVVTFGAQHAVGDEAREAEHRRDAVDPSKPQLHHRLEQRLRRR